MFMEVGSVKPNGHFGISYSKEDSGCTNKEMGREGREVISHWSLKEREKGKLGGNWSHEAKWESFGRDWRR